MLSAHFVFIAVVETWLLSAQVFSTREFSQLVIQRFAPGLASWFTIVLLPFGFAVDGAILNFHVSVGILGVLYTTFFVLRTKSWEDTAFAVAVSYTLSILLGLLTSFDAADRYSDLAVSILTAVMSGMYVNYRSVHEKAIRDTHQAVEHDALTNALTRRGLANWLERSKSRGDDEGVIVFCDLDNFKWINDTWGHDAGDRVLQEFVRRIGQGLRETDAIARFGGNEYQIWIPMKDAGTAEHIVQTLHALATYGAYHVLPEHKGIHIGVSMGWTYGAFSEERVFEADSALLSAKKAGKNRVARSMMSDTNRVEIDDACDPNLYWLTNVSQALWSGVHYPFVLTDKSGRILVANEAYEHLVGRTFDELRGNKPGINSAKKTPVKVVQELDNGNFPTAPTRNEYRWHGEIEWAFQPIVNTYLQQIIGFEALVRPTWGNEPVALDTFFRIAEKFDFILQAVGCVWRACWTSLKQSIWRRTFGCLSMCTRRPLSRRSACVCGWSGFIGCFHIRPAFLRF